MITPANTLSVFIGANVADAAGAVVHDAGIVAGSEAALADAFLTDPDALSAEERAHAELLLGRLSLNGLWTTEGDIRFFGNLPAAAILAALKIENPPQRSFANLQLATGEVSKCGRSGHADRTNRKNGYIAAGLIDESRPGGLEGVREPRENSPDYEVGLGGSLSWTKPWKVPASVENAIAAVFERGEGTITEQVRKATNVLLTWRIHQIPDPAKRKAALRALAQSFEYGQLDGRRFESIEDVNAAYEALMEIFPEQVRAQADKTMRGWVQATRRMALLNRERAAGSLPPLQDLMRRQSEFSMLRKAVFGWLGAVNAKFEAWIHPVLRKPGLELMLHIVQAHEIGGHMVAGQGGNGFLQPLVHRIFLNRLIKFLDPLDPLNTRWSTWVSEGYSTGAEWELLSRIPEQARETLRERLKETAGEHSDLLPITSDSKFRRELRRRFGEKSVDRIYHASLRYADITLEAISRARSKSDYVRLARPRSGYDFFGLLWQPVRNEYRFLRNEGVVGAFYARRFVYAATLAAYAGAYYAFL